MFEILLKRRGFFTAVLFIGSLTFNGASYAESAVQAPAEAGMSADAEQASDAELQAMSNTDIVWLTVSAIRLQRQYFVAAAMKLTPEESMAFWPVYQEYWAEMGPLRDRLWQLTGAFVAAHESLTDEQANAMINDYLVIRQEEFAIKQKYVEQFKAVLPVVKVIRYYQIENKLDSIIQYELAKRVSLAVIDESSEEPVQ